MNAAIEHLELGRKLAPQNPSPYFLLAVAYRKLGRPEQAKSMLVMVAKINEAQVEKRRKDREQDRECSRSGKCP